jgi:carbon-monoxide dehydrogenase small subunit
MLISAKALLDKDPRPSREGVVEAISGHLCRCGAYYEIIEAIQSVAHTGKKE